MNDIKDELKIYSLPEVAEILQLKKRTLYNYVRDGRLKGVKIGKAWMVKHSDLQDFINRGSRSREV